MFSNESFKYLKSIASASREDLPQPDSFEDEFIMYAEALVKGLNFSTHQKYFLEHALPDREDDNSMTGLILRNGHTHGDPYLQVRTTSDGRFMLEVHASFDQVADRPSVDGFSLAQLVKSLFDQPGFRRYFTIHTDLALGEQHHYIRYEMPLRQLRSRNLLEYSIFVLDKAAPFTEAVTALARDARQAVAA